MNDTVRTEASTKIQAAAYRPASSRLASIDIVRGLAIMVMALDHVRDFFTNVAFEPEDITQTYPALFITRWVTHFCAPAFFLLAGAGAYFYMRRAGIPRTRVFLLTRGLWLIAVEFSLVGTAWSFQFPWGFFGVIWCLGVSMILMATVISLPPRWIFGMSLIMIATHDLFDSFRPSSPFALAAWSLFHVKGGLSLGPIHSFVLFPIVPWVGVMMLGHGLGYAFESSPQVSRRVLGGAGAATMVLFVLLRSTNLYGNPPIGLGGVSQGPWHTLPSVAKTLMLFFDVEKYPPSLQYLLMTLGPIFLLLALLSGFSPKWRGNPLLVFGRVPLLFYVLHLYLIHLLAVLFAKMSHQPSDWLLHGAFFRFDLPEGYGYGLAIIYVIWLVVLMLLYPLCAFLAQWKERKKSAWLSYL